MHNKRMMRGHLGSSLHRGQLGGEGGEEGAECRLDVVVGVLGVGQDRQDKLMRLLWAKSQKRPRGLKDVPKKYPFHYKKDQNNRKCPALIQWKMHSAKTVLICRAGRAHKKCNFRTPSHVPM